MFVGEWEDFVDAAALDQKSFIDFEGNEGLDPVSARVAFILKSLMYWILSRNVLEANFTILAKYLE